MCVLVCVCVLCVCLCVLCVCVCVYTYRSDPLPTAAPVGEEEETGPSGLLLFANYYYEQVYSSKMQ